MSISLNKTTYLKLTVDKSGDGSCLQVVEFANNVIHNNQVLNLLPASVTPSMYKVKNVERAIDGKAHIDISAVTQQIIVRFDLLGNREFEFLTGLFEINKVEMPSVDVEYFDFIGENCKCNAKCFVDSFTYTPFIIEDELRWRDVEITLIEICGTTAKEEAANGTGTV